jgi:hypothetical protein
MEDVRRSLLVVVAIGALDLGKAGDASSKPELRESWCRRPYLDGAQSPRLG